MGMLLPQWYTAILPLTLLSVASRIKAEILIRKKIEAYATIQNLQLGHINLIVSFSSPPAPPFSLQHQGLFAPLHGD